MHQAVASFPGQLPGVAAGSKIVNVLPPWGTLSTDTLP
jgi:hypothetical protein